MKGLRSNRNGSLLTISLAISLIFSASGQVYGQPPFPTGKPTAPDVRPYMIKGTLKPGALPSNVGPNDSVLVISGKVDTGGYDYHAIAVWAAPSPELITACDGRDVALQLQYKKTEAEGYKIFLIFKDTASKPGCFSSFKNVKTVKTHLSSYIFNNPGDEDKPLACFECINEYPGEFTVGPYKAR